MRELIVYMLETLACSAVLMLLYGVLFDRRVSFAFCRAYLPVSVVAAAVIPLLRIPVWSAVTEPLGGNIVAGEIVSTLVVEGHATAAVGVREILLIAYAGGVVLSFAAMAVQLCNIWRLARGGKLMRERNPRIVRTAERIASFSFFDTIYLSREIGGNDIKAIVAHESSHIRHRHSAEKVAMQLLRALMWWNPFVWIAQRRLTEVHEYEADADVLGEGYDVNDYITSILKSLLGYSPDIANSFRDSLTKKRFKMMTTKKTSRYALLRTLTVLPVAAALLCTFSFTAKAEQTAVPVPEAETAAPVVETVAPEVCWGNCGDGWMPVLGKPQKDEVLMQAEVMPKFNGGEVQDFRTWVMSQIHYPESMVKGKIQGRMLVEFVINKEGKLTDFHVIKELHKDASEQIADVLSKSPLWTPGQNNGKAVSMKFILPLDFRLSSPAWDEKADAASEPKSKAGKNEDRSKEIDEIVVMNWSK